MHKHKCYLTNSSFHSFHVTTRPGHGSVMGGWKSCFVLLKSYILFHRLLYFDFQFSLWLFFCFVFSFYQSESDIQLMKHFMAAGDPPSFPAGCKLWVNDVGCECEGQGGGVKTKCWPSPGQVQNLESLVVHPGAAGDLQKPVYTHTLALTQWVLVLHECLDKLTAAKLWSQNNLAP